MCDGKTAIVTGGSRGIGAACALKLAKAGADVAIIAAHDSESAQNVISQIREIGRKASLYVCDVADSLAVNETVDAVIKDFGYIDILVNNAGITRDKLLIQMMDEDIDEVLDVNLKGCMFMTRACIRPFMRQKFGRIINIASVVGISGNAGQANYAASKAGVIGFTKTVAKEYATKNITCNAIAPGFIETDMTGAMSESARTAILGEIPLGRPGSPEDVAALCAFLAGEGASYITGEVIRVDGGMSI